MSVNTRKQRNYLYNQTFLKWTVEQRLSEFERTSIDVTLAIHKFGNKANDETFDKLAESLADFETMLETAEETFPSLRAKMDKIIKAKLTVLKKQGQANGFKEKAKKIEEDALNVKNIVEKQQTEVKKSKGLKKLFRN